MIEQPSADDRRQQPEDREADGERVGDVARPAHGGETGGDRPEFGDAAKIRGYLNAFEEKQKLLQLLEQTLLADGVRVFIGSEAALQDVRDISVISSPYRRDGSSVGSFGIVGPTRPETALVPDEVSDG